MFDILDRPLVWIPVVWPGLKPGGPDGSGIAEAVENEIEVRVEIKDADGSRVLFDPNESERKTPKVDAFLQFTTDWRKIKSGGNPLPFTRENAQLLIERQLPFFDAWRMAYINAALGRVELREGNSGGSPDNGQAGDGANAPANPKLSETANASE